ncbi:hypothetical protein ABT352_00680 [Streptosporangium sp. NPDC000563]|uniref:hypothetical protein n=1 Tax=Streptosporangium sp. NPDC000563 TaxID=3154366 RepID=UPI0033344EC8
MPDKALSLPEIAALLVLMIEAREISNPELKERHGLTLTGEARRNLNDLKLVESRKEGRSFAHVLTNAGWAALATELRAGVVLPERSGSAGVALRAVLFGLQSFMERSDCSLTDIFGGNSAPVSEDSSGDPAPAPAASSDDPAPTTLADTLAEAPMTPASVNTPAETPTTPASADTPAAPPAPVALDVEQRIRAAYRKLATEPGAWVSLTRLRPLLGEVPRATVDETLIRMNRMSNDVNIIPEANQKTLSQKDRDAAVTMGEQEKHLLKIEAR